MGEGQRIPREQTFSEYLKNACSFRDPLQDNNARWVYPRPVMDWIQIDGKIAVDYICNMHTYDQDFERIKYIFGKQELPHVNSTDHKDYRTYYNEEEVELVSRAFKSDIDFFGFDFEDKTRSNFQRVQNPAKMKKFLPML